ncbi:MAG: NAD+ synthase [Theionarchaea archaeon]|nr:NAD+ synthase [Theionarchaea archaeon]
MLIVVAQLNFSVGDLQGNTRKILDVFKIHRDKDLVIFPELSISGYPPQDLIFNSQFVKENRELLSVIARECPTSAVVGFIDSSDGCFYNAAAIIQENRITGIQYKILLPNYDVFDERRYFTPGKTQQLFTIQGHKIGVEICEDLWEQGYEDKPTSHLLEMGAEIIINISASPFCTGKAQERISLAQSYSAIPLFVYCNLVGGQDELIFDGQSFVLQKGTLVRLGRSFQEDIFVIDSDMSFSPLVFTSGEEESLFRALTLGLRDYCEKNYFNRIVFGLSGGIDSSLVACIAAEAMGAQNVTALFMPSRYTSSESREDACLLAQNLGISLIILPIDNIFSTYNTTLAPVFSGLTEDVTEENIQARIRGNLLMAYSNKFGHLVLPTGNKTELALGYCTLYGDMSGGLAVIGDVSKIQVYELAQYYNTMKGKIIIPERVFSRPPSAELREGQVDPFDYSVVSPLVDLIIEERLSKPELISLGYEPELVSSILKRIHSNEYKRRQAAPVLKITKKAFGGGRRFPIANQYI